MKIICLIPVKNEAWILGYFLESASKWADVIIVADQNSSDGSDEIANSFEKVVLVKNTTQQFNEPDRQKLLIMEARKITGKKLLIALDADEILESSDLRDRLFHLLTNHPPGTRFNFECMNLHPELDKYWTKGYHYYGYIDDEALHIGKEIDSPRLPQSESSFQVNVSEIKLFHLQYLNSQRILYKQIWYQCLEKTLKDKSNYLSLPKNNFYLFERYNKYRFQQKDIQSLPLSWLFTCEKDKETFKRLSVDSNYPHLSYIKELFDNYGTDFFKDLNIWDVDWNSTFFANHYSDPRNLVTKIIHKWLNNRNALYFSKKEKRIIWILEKLKLF